MLEDKDKKLGRFEVGNTGVSFENEWRQPAQDYYLKTPKMSQWIINHSGGLVKNRKQASYVLLGFAVVAVIVSLVLFFGGRNAKTLYKEDIMGPNGLPVNKVI